ncbi:hypothetical protein BC936DRAFT_149228 [Jimgerdemannia flammicorona]|uniref:Tubulin--tyrosine ligase-like protein 12 SET-like domain-containing protein n=1 Tax=Jimgerdemannia flammicorona TaxID=994334 RepID=A0A433D192_9FUNG|nr:hypothetical protein BC936DRAFT_149228 [Jimgerdemannia flammicorona]
MITDVMDELGSAIGHSDVPNVRIAPFFYLETNTCYTVAWSTQDVAVGEKLTRDYMATTKDPACREAISCVYLPDALDRLSDKFVELNRKRVRDLDARAVITFKGAKDVDVDDLGDAMRAVSIDVPTSGPEPEPKRKFVYYTDHPLLAASIAYSPHFIRTTERDEADIVWVCYTLSDPRPVKRSSDVASAPQCVNQFPNQNLLTVKDLLIATLHAYFGYAELKGWVPRTYNLNTECREWLGEVVERRKRQGKREKGGSGLRDGRECVDH